MRRLILMCVTLALLVPQSILAQKPSNADAEAIKKISEEYAAAILAQDGARLARLYAEDAVHIRPQGAPILTGRSNIQKLFEETFAIGPVIEAKLTSDETRVAADWVLDRGTFVYKQNRKDGGTPIQSRQNYVHIFQRQRDGSWKITW